MSEIVIPLPGINDLTMGAKHATGKLLCSLAKGVRSVADRLDEVGSALVKEAEELRSKIPAVHSELTTENA